MPKEIFWLVIMARANPEERLATHHAWLYSDNYIIM